jgi:hypothetical protein
MNKLKSFITTALVVLTTSAAYAEDIPALPESAGLGTFKNMTYDFEIPSPSKQKRTGQIKFQEEKDFVMIEFEGKNLEKGKYQISQGDSCNLIKKNLNRKSGNAKDENLFSFETKYGDISTEKKLEKVKFDDLKLKDRSIALIKIEKPNSKTISCIDSAVK